MGKGSAPQAPDPYQTAAAQYQYGTKAASYQQAMNQVNTQNPYSSTSYKQTGTGVGGAPVYTETTQLNPQAQAAYNAQLANQTGQAQAATGALGRANNAIGQPLNVPQLQQHVDTSGVPGIVGQNDIQSWANQNQNAAYQSQMGYLQPQFQQQTEQLDAQLRNSGAHPGDPAYDNAMKLMQQGQAQQQQQAFNQSYQTGTQAGQALYGESANTNQQLYGEAAANQQAYNQAAGQQFGLQTGDINQLLSEYGALSGVQQFGTGGAQEGNNVQTPNIMGAFENQYQGQLAGYNAKVSSANATEGSVATIAAAAAIAY
jgi:hypothetical protein